MLEALVEGTHDPEVLAHLARGQLRRKLPALQEALTGRFLPVHRVLVSEILAHIDYIDKTVDRLGTEIDKILVPFTTAVDLLDTIPGINRRTAQVIIAEIGADMARFSCEQQLASWAGMCPGNNESAGKHFSGKTRKGPRWLRQALVESAQVAARTKGTYFSAQCARIKGRHGYKKAIVAVAHSLLVVAYYVLLRQQAYVEHGDDYFIKRQRKESYRRRLVSQLERIGYEVNLTPKEAA